ncbi:MAG: lipopolysaccharide biosynthesis protein [Nitrospinaceae bacterium]
MSNVHRFITNAAWNIGGKLFIQLIYFVVSILIFRYLGRQGLGIYASLLVVPAIVRLFNALGLESVLNKKLPELNIEDPSGRQGRFFVRGILGFRLISSLVCAAGMYWALPVYSQWVHVPVLLDYRLELVLYFFAVTVNSILGVLFMALVRFRTVTFAEGINAGLNLLLLLAAVAMDWGIRGVLWAYIAATGIQLAIYLHLARPHLRGAAQSTDLREAWRLAGVAYAINLFSLGLWTQSDVVLMNYFQVPAAGVGSYHLATSLGAMVLFLLAGLGQLAQSFYSEAYAREGAPGLSRTWRMTLGLNVWVTLPLGIIGFVFAPPLITWVFGAEYAPVAPLFRVYVVFLVIAAALGSDLNIFALFVLHRRRAAFWISFEGSVWNLILDVIWIPRYGELGAVMATGSVMVYLVLRQIVSLKDVLRPGQAAPLVGGALGVSLAALVPGMILQAMGVEAVWIQAGLYPAAFWALLILVKPLPVEAQTWAQGISPVWGRWTRRWVRS